MNLLAIDTSTASGSVAILRDNSVLCESIINAGSNHSQTILPAIAALFRTAQMDFADVDLLAVTSGPGSFTGLRIGISLVKGLALALSRPVIAVSTLDALALNLFSASILICPFLDAKRGQVYASLYKTDSAGFPQRICPERVTDPKQFLESIHSEVVLLGDGTQSYADLIQKVLPGRHVIAPLHLQYIRASSVGQIALTMFQEQEFSDPLTLAPKYVRMLESEGMGRS